MDTPYSDFFNEDSQERLRVHRQLERGMKQSLPIVLFQRCMMGGGKVEFIRVVSRMELVLDIEMVEAVAKLAAILSGSRGGRCEVFVRAPIGDGKAASLTRHSRSAASSWDHGDDQGGHGVEDIEDGHALI